MLCATRNVASTHTLRRDKASPTPADNEKATSNSIACTCRSAIEQLPCRCRGQRPDQVTREITQPGKLVATVRWMAGDARIKNDELRQECCDKQQCFRVDRCDHAPRARTRPAQRFDLASGHRPVYSTSECPDKRGKPPRPSESRSDASAAISMMAAMPTTTSTS